MGGGLVARATFTPIGLPTKPNSIVTLASDERGSRIFRPGERPIVDRKAPARVASPFISAYWLTGDVSPEQQVDAVKHLYSSLAKELFPNQPSHYIFWDVQAHHYVEIEKVSIDEVIEKYLTPASARRMLRIESPGVGVWSSAGVSSSDGTEVAPSIAGLIFAHPLPLEVVLDFYHSTSGFSGKPEGLISLTRMMRRYEKVQAAVLG